MVTLDSLVDLPHCYLWPDAGTLERQAEEGPDALDAVCEISEAGFEMQAEGHTFRPACPVCREEADAQANALASLLDRLSDI